MTSICANITVEKLFLKGFLRCFNQYFRRSIFESLPYQIMLQATWCMQSIIQLSDLLFQEKRQYPTLSDVGYILTLHVYDEPFEVHGANIYSHESANVLLVCRTE